MNQETVIDTAINETDMPRSANNYRCSLVIPTKNGGQLFHTVVDALRKQSCWDAVEFIVVDSGSNDDTVEIARRAGAKVYPIPPEQFNHGATRDYGISLAGCDRIILMVQDAIPLDSELIENLLNALNEQGVAGAYARQIPQESADAITKRNLNNWLTGRLERESRVIPEQGWYEAQPPMEQYFFCNFDNVCSAINKNVWRQEKFGALNFAEDIDWAKRVLLRGYKIVYEPKAAVIHSHDRPLSYEYKRTYVCHRRLYSLFRLHLVPSLPDIRKSWLFSTLADIKYVIKNEQRLWHKLKILVKIPILNLLSAFAQYYAVQDEINGLDSKVKGV